MITRREFLKISGFGAAAFATGYFTGNLVSDFDYKNYILSGFIKAEESVISGLIHAFIKQIRTNARPKIISENKYGSFIYTTHLRASMDYDSAGGVVIYRLKRLDTSVPGDLVFGNKQSSVCSPDKFDSVLSDIRHLIRKTYAGFLFTVEYKETGFLRSLFSSDNNQVVIENNKGLVDKINLTKNYYDIKVPGAIGSIGLSIHDSIVRVHTASCRNSLCKHTIADKSGNIIVCAPNKLLVKVI